MIRNLKLTAALAGILLASGLWRPAAATAGPIEIPANAGTRIAAMEARTNAWNFGAHQTDTNANTDVTLYTPRAFGDLLVGGQVIAGVTNMDVWFANGTTSNDWLSLGTRVHTALLLVAPQRDTNSATDTAEYTPRYDLDVLYGRTDAATGACWIAVGTETNSWQLLGVAPAAE